MLTEFVNKVYLLSYNACETRYFRYLKSDFSFSWKNAAFHSFTVSVFEAAFQWSRSHPHITPKNSEKAILLSISPANQYYTLLH